MKYAIIYRGISFLKDYIYDYAPEPYTIDFDDCIEFHKQNLINPLREQGNEVDIFFNTYNSEKLNDYTQDLKPVYVHTKEFNSQIKKYNFAHIAQINIESLTIVNEYQKQKNVKYDFVILNRFDLVIFRDFSKIFTPKDAISVPTRNDDMFIVFAGYLLEDSINIIKKYQNSCISHHLVYKFLEHGFKYHEMFSLKPEEVGPNDPLFRIARLMFCPDSHKLKEYNFKDVFNKNSKFYGFLREPNKIYTQPEYKKI